MTNTKTTVVQLAAIGACVLAAIPNFINYPHPGTVFAIAMCGFGILSNLLVLSFRCMCGVAWNSGFERWRAARIAAMRKAEE